MCDKIIIVGAGLAGMVAAYTAAKEGAEVVLIDRGTIGMGTNSCLANGVFAGPTPSYTADSYMQDTIETGRRINRQSSVRLVAQGAPEAFQFLRFLGLRVRETSVHHIVESPVSGIIPGVVLMKKLSEAVGDLRNVQIMKGFYVTDILTGENRVSGVKGMNRQGEESAIQSPVIVLAAGGAGAVYLKNDNQKNIMGQGYYLAARAGLQLWDMEFVQFFPLVAADSRLPQVILYPPYPKEARLVNASGDDIMAKLNLGDVNKAILQKRDEFSACLYEEAQNGPIYMDFRDVPGHLWGMHPLSLLRRLKFDFRTKPVSVSPAAHFFMGGVRVDESGQTDINGLFACGEILWGLHGANRMGGNAMTECVVTGGIAGRHAARYCRDFRSASLREETFQTPSVPERSLSKGDLKKLLGYIREIAWNYAGVVRSEKDMQEGLAKVEEIKRRLKGGILKDDPGEKFLMEDLRSALFVLEAILTAGAGRQESRGSFINSDFPQEDNVNWCKNSCLRYRSGEERFSVGYHPIYEL